MRKLTDRIGDGDVLVCDGAMGTMLHSYGLKAGECPELWCVDRPNDVREIHRSYREAGSNIVECNSFGGTRYRLRHFGLADRAAELNRAAAALAREVAGNTQYVLGCMGPTGEFMEPYGTETVEDFYSAFKEQVVALEEGGADAVIVETMTGLEETSVAVRAARENTRMVVMVSLTFDPQRDGSYATMMGVRPEQFAKTMTAMGVDVIGANCGIGPHHMLPVVKCLRTASVLPIIAMPNAGMPVVENGETVFKETPEEMARMALKLVESGARIVGGCCGTTPAHIAAMKSVLNDSYGKRGQLS